VSIAEFVDLLWQCTYAVDMVDAGSWPKPKSIYQHSPQMDTRVVF